MLFQFTDAVVSIVVCNYLLYHWVSEHHGRYFAADRGKANNGYRLQISLHEFSADSVRGVAHLGDHKIT